MALGRLFSAIAGGLIGGPVGFAVALGGSLAFGAVDARKARRQAEQNRRQRDLTITMPTAARRRIYGTDRVPGVLRYWTTHGAENRLLSLVYVFADHPCESIDEIHFDDKAIGTLDGSGFVTSGPWYKASQAAAAQNLAATAGVITLPTATASVPTVSLAGSYYPGWIPPVSTSDSGFVDLTPGVDFTHTLGSTTITLAGALAGLTVPSNMLVVNWVSNTGRALARVRKYLGAVPQTADATLITDSGGEWTSACRLDNQCYAIVTLEWDETTAANGIPVVQALIKGAKVYDPRTTTTAWSDNWALCVRDYIKTASGCADSEIDDATVIEAANKADENVTVDDGTIKRYTLNGSVESTTNPVEALEDMALAGGGIVAWSAGKFRVLAGMYRTPVSITLTDADLAGGYKYQGEIAREDRFNVVIGAFRDARAIDGTKLYTRTDYSAYESSAYITEDGGAKIERRIDLDYVTDYRAANRIAKQIMRRARQGARITAAWKLKALPLQVGDVVTVSLTRPGLVAKPFEVVSARYAFPNAVELVLQETDPTCYDWSSSEVAFLDPAPNTLLPSPTFVAQPVLSVLCTADAPATIKTLTDGSQIPYARVSWPARTNAAEYVEIRWKRSFETGYRTLRTRIGDTFVDIEGISGGDTLQIVGVAVNGIGARSEPWIIQAFKVDERLPRYSGVLPALSANMLRNATFETTAAGWEPYVFGGVPANAVGVARHQDPVLRIAGSPSSIYVECNSTTLSGNTYSVGVLSTPFAVAPGQRWCGYAALSPISTDATVYLNFYDAAGAVLSQAAGTVVSARASVQWNDPSTYTTSVVFAQAPAGARTGRLVVAAQGNWLAGLFKYVSIHKPFAGIVPEGSVDAPVWEAGGTNALHVTRSTSLPGPLATGVKGPGVPPWHRVFNEAGLPAGSLKVTVTALCVSVVGSGGAAVVGSSIRVTDSTGAVATTEGGMAPAAWGVPVGTRIEGGVLITYTNPAFRGGAVDVDLLALRYTIDNTTAVLTNISTRVEVNL